jgi:hypothetical protein
MSAPAAVLAAAAPAESFERVLAGLAFLAPDIQMAIVHGRELPGLTPESLKIGFPLAWADQRRMLGIDAR